ncbi:MAG: YbjN domain-containing protein [Thermoguttaceae bacterium]|nr:YbjN domain-containing protein [Thermoguttaceae bacterium]
MKNVTLEQLRELLDETEVSHKKKDDVLVAGLAADEDFGYDVVVLFTVEGELIRAIAGSAGFQAPRGNRRQALEFCNSWNDDKSAPRAYLDEEGYFRLDASLYTDVDVDASYIKKYFIRLFMTTSWQFFKTAGQELTDVE